MNKTIIIYGKAGCPYTDKARAAYPDHEYKDVKKDTESMARMLKLSGGKRRVPVIVNGDDVTIGYGGT